MSNIKSVIIGTGGIARSHVAAQRAESERTELVAAMDIDAERASAFCETHKIPRAYTDAAEMLAQEQPQIVHICTPPGTHCDLTVMSLEAGAWVLCEKPLCASLAEMDRVEEAEQRTGNYCSSVFQWRFGSGGRHMKQLIDSGRLGYPTICTNSTTWWRGKAYYDVPWRGHWETELGGCTMIHGIHAMDFMLWLLGEWSEVRAMMGTLVHDINVEDVSMAMVRFANGAMANVTNSVVSPRQESYLRFDFQKATVELTHLYNYVNENWKFTMLENLTEAEGAQAELDAWSTINDDYRSTHASQLKSFIDSYRQGTRPEVSGSDVRGTIEFLCSLYKSAMTGMAVDRGSITPDDPFYHNMNGPGDQGWQQGKRLAL